jgi:hypothetical protein
MTPEEEHYDTQKVEQNKVGFCTDPFLFYTDGLGPCIGICIAWRSWAGIVHSSNIFDDEDDIIRELIEAAKQVIPKTVIPRIRPFICGGDTEDPYGIDDMPEQHAVSVLKGRARILRILKDAGFGKPHVNWSENQTGALVADLKNLVVYAEQDGAEVGRWPIIQELPA